MAPVETGPGQRRAGGQTGRLRTIEAHRGQLRTKLGLHTRAELSTYAREHGLVR